MKNTLNASTNDLNQLIQQAGTQHHPVKLQNTTGGPAVVLINQADLETARAIIRASLGRDVSFLTA
ncbi:hypothetical protein [Levilactobacillus cerevisiae]|uniref:hypothetical protein n=1 Tax=Levilactobacillus cerevisiae TaxID=1704076 RepID=UPI000F7B534A|nr:hypothetical protein [Levilactobacillus cerevisiae]